MKRITYNDLNSFSDFEEFISLNKILNRKDFKERFNRGYSRFNKKLTEEEKDELLPKNLGKHPELQTKEDIRNFIKINSIKSKKDFKKRFKSIYVCKFSKLSEGDRLELFPEKYDYKFFEKFIKTNKITCRTDLKKYKGGIYYKFIKLSEEEQNKLLPLLYNPCTISTFSEIDNFVKENNLSSRCRLAEFNSTVYKRFKELTEEEQNKIFPNNDPYDYIESTEDIIKFIEDNNINSKCDLNNKFHSVYNKFEKLSEEDKKKIVFKNELIFENYKYSDFETLKDFQNFVDERGVLTNMELRDDFTPIYRRYIKLRKSWKPEEEIKYPEESSRKILGKLNSLEDFQNYVNSKGIKSITEFNKDSASSRFFRKIPQDQRKLLKFEVDTRPFDFGDTFQVFDDFQEFINDNQISSLAEWGIKFPRTYGRLYRKLDEVERSMLVFYKDKNLDNCKYHSAGETFLIKLFNENNINFVTEKTFPGLKNEKALRFDFYLLDYNILIEYHGSQHFETDNDYYTEQLIKNDHIKFEYCKNNGITLLYFTLATCKYKRWGYFTEVITDPEILINKIKKIGMTNQPQ